VIEIGYSFNLEDLHDVIPKRLDFMKYEQQFRCSEGAIKANPKI
jgi:hypothetical protein